MKYTCPHCGEKTFNPLQKGLCGSITSVGKRCPSCNGRCVNGKLSLAVRTLLTLGTLGYVIYNYFSYYGDEKNSIILKGMCLIAASYAVAFLFDMFFGKLIPAIKRE